MSIPNTVPVVAGEFHPKTGVATHVAVLEGGFLFWRARTTSAATSVGAAEALTAVTELAERVTTAEESLVTRGNELQAVGNAVDELIDQNGRTRRFMRAGPGNESLAVFQYTDDGTDGGDNLVNDYQAIATGNPSAAQLELLLTDEAAVGVWLLQGNRFDFEAAVSRLYLPHHTIVAGDKEYRPIADATPEQLAVSPLAGDLFPSTSGYYEI